MLGIILHATDSEPTDIAEYTVKAHLWAYLPTFGPV